MNLPSTFRWRDLFSFSTGGCNIQLFVSLQCLFFSFLFFLLFTFFFFNNFPFPFSLTWLLFPFSGLNTYFLSLFPCSLHIRSLFLLAFLYLRASTPHLSLNFPISLHHHMNHHHLPPSHSLLHTLFHSVFIFYNHYNRTYHYYNHPHLIPHTYRLLRLIPDTLNPH